MAAPSRKRATLEDLEQRDDRDRLEIVDGELVERAAPSPNHSFAGIKVGVAIDPFNRRPGARGPGGWWSFTEIHVSYSPAGELYCHDVAGWRRERLPERPTKWPVVDRPDWVCEIVSPNHERTDLVDKPRTLHASGVPHYWVLDPEERILLVHRWSADGYLVIQRAKAGEKIRAEPFEVLELEVGVLFGDEETE